jgi:ribonuclease R
MSVLRAQTQAIYSPDNFGHFGLNLARYAHFTSPIRRYADLIVHRALISALGLGADPKQDGLTIEDAAALRDTATHISQTERRAMLAERDSSDRYLAAFMEDRIGAEFDGIVSGVARFGLFVKLNETGADGLIPISTLGTEYYTHDPDTNTLRGERSGTLFRIGMRVLVRLEEAVPLAGGLRFSLVEGGEEGKPSGRGRGNRRPPIPKGRRAGKGRKGGKGRR